MVILARLEDAVEICKKVRNQAPPTYNLRRLRELPIPSLSPHRDENPNWFDEVFDYSVQNDNNDSNNDLK